MTDRQKSTHPLHLSVSFLSFKAKSFACSSLLSLSLLLCLVHENEHLIFVHFYFFCATFWFLHSNCPLPCSNPASLSAPLLSLSVSRSLFLSSSHPPLSPSSILLLASLFCAVPQGPPGPQGSPHPQPPPPNSMMGPHSQVTLPLPLSLPFLCFCYLRSFGNAGSQC